MKRVFFISIILMLAVLSYGQYNPTNKIGSHRISVTDGKPLGLKNKYNPLGEAIDVNTYKRYFFNPLDSTWFEQNLNVTQVTGISMYSPLSYQYSVASDGENNFSIPFTLEEGAMIFYNGWIIDDIEWDGNGTNVLDLDFPTSKNDKISVNTGLSYYQSTTHKYEVPSDGIVNITVPFELKSTTLVFFNGWLVDNTLWTGVGTTTLTLLVHTLKYDLITVNLH